MKSVINWESILNNIYEQLKKDIKQAQQQDSMNITSTNSGNINKDLLYLNDEYNMYFEKLEDIKIIKEENMFEYLKNLIYIEEKDINIKTKLLTILSYGSVLAINSRINKKTQEEIYTISYTTRQIDKNNLGEYIPTLFDEQILQKIMKPDSLDSRDNIVYELTQLLDQSNDQNKLDNIIQKI